VTKDLQDISVMAVFLDVGFLLENTAVFQSQVADQLIALCSMGYSTGMVAVSRDAPTFERTVGSRLREAGVEIYLVPDGRFYQCLWEMTRTLRRVARTRKVTRAYVRGIWGAVVVMLAGLGQRIPYVYDVRGDLHDEMMASGTHYFKRVIYGSMERWSIRNARKVSAVTRALSEIVSRSHRLDGVSVVPCCVDVSAMTSSSEQAIRRRIALGFLERECVVCYSGGLSHYQQVPAMLAIWRQLCAEADLRFLLLTNEDPHRAPMMVGDLRDFGDRLLHLSLPRAEVATTLAAADIGFMLRDSRELNRVASPVKFPEYLAAGLAVVGSPGTGDASGLIVDHDVGVLVDPSDIGRSVVGVRTLIARWRIDMGGYKRRARILAASHFDWRAHASTFQELYGATDRTLVSES
jgi:glycosyltransferase involved in cell wall biosynthesis